MLLWVHATGKSRVKIKDRLYNWQLGEWPHFVPLHDSRELVRSSFSAGAEAATTKSLSLHGRCLQRCLPQPCPPSQAAELMQQTCTEGMRCGMWGDRVQPAQKEQTRTGCEYTWICHICKRFCRKLIRLYIYNVAYMNVFA